MSSEKELRNWIYDAPDPNSCYLQKFRLYETRSNFYMIGRDKNRTFWRVLKIDRLEPSELNILEDSMSYSENECCDLLKRIHEGNKSTGGLKFVTTCYGIVGFIKFLGPYYILIITKRRKLGTICGHTIYAITKSEMLPIPNSTVQSNMAYSKNENRSFVNFSCKCNVSLVLLRITKRLTFRTIDCHMYLDENCVTVCCFSLFQLNFIGQLLESVHCLNHRHIILRGDNICTIFVYRPLLNQ